MTGAVNASDHFVLDRQMGLTHDDFFRTIPSVVNGYTHEIDTNGITVSFDGGTIEIWLGDQGERRIASLVLPTTPVRFEFRNLDVTQRTRFLEHFDLYFRRGGG